MATAKPRITITLTKRQHEVLKSISDNSGQSMSSMICEFIEVAMPTFERMAVTFQKIKQAKDANRERIVGILDDAQDALEPIAQAVTGQFDMFMGRVEDAAAAGGALATPAADASDAPPTNRGATTNRSTARKASTGKALKGV